MKPVVATVPQVTTCTVIGLRSNETVREKEGREPVVANRTTGSENEKQAFQVQASFSEANTETIDNGK